MSQFSLPSRYIKTSLENVVEILDSQRKPINNSERTKRIEGKPNNELFPYFGATGEVGKIDDYIFDDELVALGEDGVPFLEHQKRKAYIIKGKTWVNNHAHVLKSIPCLTENRYLCYFLNHFDYKDYVNGGTRLKLTQANMRKIPFNIIPLAEQKIIADKLDDLLARVESIKTRLENIPEILKKFRQSVLSAAVSGKLTEEWRINNVCEKNPITDLQKYKETWVSNNSLHNEAKRVSKRLKLFKTRKQIFDKELPEKWSWQNLEDSVLMIVDCHNKTAPYSDSGIPIVRTSNIRDGKLNWEGMKFVERETYEYWSRRCQLQTGDIIFTREAPMGEATIVPDGQQLCLGQRTMLIRPIEKYISAEFILSVLMAPSFKKKAESFAVGTGVKHYRVGDVSNLPIPVPPKEEQDEVVRYIGKLFSYADSIEKAAVNALLRINNLTQSILAKAFRGELTAQWREENPELISGLNSAEALLEKITAEKLASGTIKKRAKKSSH